MPRVSDAFGEFSTDVDLYFRELATGFNITASLVADENGNTVSDAGNSSGLGNETDLALLIALRRQSQVILTSGKTFRNDHYKFPKQADLAVLTNQAVEIVVPFGRKLIISSGGYQETLNEISASSYEHVHVEYGITGIRSLVQAKALDALFLSSRSESGVLALAQNLNIQPIVILLEDLYVGLVAWQPSGSQLAR